MSDLSLSDLAKEKFSTEIFVATTPEQNLGDILGLHDEATKKSGNYIVYRYLGTSAGSLDLLSSTFVLVDRKLDEAKKIPTKMGFPAYALNVPIGTKVKSAKVSWSLLAVGKDADPDLTATTYRSKLEVYNRTFDDSGLARTLKIVWTGDVHQPPQEDIIASGESFRRESRGIGNGGNFRTFNLDVYREKDGAWLPSGGINIPVWNGGPRAPGSSYALLKTYIATSGEVVLSCEYPLKEENIVTDLAVFSRSDW